MDEQKLYVGCLVEVDLPGYKHHGKRGVILRLKTERDIDYADVRLFGMKRAVEFVAFHLKPVIVDVTQLEIKGLLES